MSTAYHPETDGASERANRMMLQMLRQCVQPFYLNSGQLPRSMIWDVKTEYPGVRVFARRMKDAIVSAHDTILEARVQQTRQANKHRRPAPFELNDLVYLSTKHIRLPKQRLQSGSLLPSFKYGDPAILIGKVMRPRCDVHRERGLCR